MLSCLSSSSHFNYWYDYFIMWFFFSIISLFCLLPNEIQASRRPVCNLAQQPGSSLHTERLSFPCRLLGTCRSTSQQLSRHGRPTYTFHTQTALLTVNKGDAGKSRQESGKHEQISLGKDLVVNAAVETPLQMSLPTPWRSQLGEEVFTLPWSAKELRASYLLFIRNGAYAFQTFSEHCSP